jgi:hypothetical protein
VWRLWLAATLLVLFAVGAADWAVSMARLGAISIETAVNPAPVLADGKSSTTITLRVTENEQPRAGDLVQLWISSGSGLLVPEWVMTDENGSAQVVFTPNALSPYDLSSGTEITLQDINIGRIIEVGKRLTVPIPLQAPQ